MMRRFVAGAVLLAAVSAFAAVSEPIVLWQAGDQGVNSYRIPALVTAPNGDLVAMCDARRDSSGDLNHGKVINITCRRSSDGGKTWTEPENTWTWDWNDDEHWAGSDPSLVVDPKTKKIFCFYNVWESKKQWVRYQFWVQESSDNGKTWSKPRDISKDIAFPEWNFGRAPDDKDGYNKGQFIFITSGTGMYTKEGWLVHTIVNVRVGNALFGSKDHGKTWEPIGKPVAEGDECKVVELNDGSWMINSRWRKDNTPGRMIHISKDKGETWESHYDTNLTDPQCNAQIMAIGKPGKRVLLFSNCNSGGRNKVSIRASKDDGKTWGTPVLVDGGGSAYSDITLLKDQKPLGEKTIGILWEGAGYGSIKFATVPLADIIAPLKETK